MKLPKILLLSFALLTNGYTQNSDKIREYELSESTVFEVPTSTGVTTTLVFPAAIGIVGGDLVTEPGKEVGKFSLTTGPNHFTVSALVEKGRTNLTVFCEGKAYSLELVASSEPIFKAHFVYVSDSTRSIEDGQRQFDEINGKFLEDVGKKRAFSVNRIVGFLDKARALPVLAVQDPNPVADILFMPKEKVYNLDKFTVELKEVFRDNALDAIAFKLIFKSLDGKQHLYDPESFGVSAGERYYRQIISAADGVIPAIGAKEAFFAISGDGMGGRNDLSLHTEFGLHFSMLNPSDYFTEDRSGPGATIFNSDEIIGKVYDEDLLLKHLTDQGETPNLPILPHEHDHIDPIIEPQEVESVTPSK